MPLLVWQWNKPAHVVHRFSFFEHSLLCGVAPRGEDWLNGK